MMTNSVRSGSILRVLLIVAVAWCGCTMQAAPAAEEPIKPVYNTWGPVVKDLGLDDPREPININGFVFVDANENAEFDGDDQRLAGVLVSDGNQVVKTDAKGQYELLVVPGLQRFAWVVVPSGYRIGGNFYRKIDLEAKNFSHNFALIPAPKSSNPNHSFGHLSDAHGNDGALWEGLTPELFEFVILTGDLVNNGGNTSTVTAMKKAFEKASVPVIPLPGNHDQFFNGSGELLTRSFFERQKQEEKSATDNAPDAGAETWEDFFGPSYHSFEYGGRQFILLNTSAERDRQRVWTQNLLAMLPKDREIIVCQHYPPEIEESEFWEQVPGVRAILYGHTHADAVFKHKGILHINSVGVAHSRDRSPLTVRKVTFEDADIKLTNLTREFEDQADLPPLPQITPEAGDMDVQLGAEWPDYKGGPARTGVAEENAAGAPWQPAWIQTLGGVAYIGSPVVSDKALYVGLGDRRNQQEPAIYALNPGSGEILWQQETGPNPLPALGPKDIFVATRDARVSSLDRQSGQENWNYSLGHPMVYRLYTHPTWIDGKVLAGNGKHFTALDAETGKPLWRMPDSGAGMWTTFSASAVADGTLMLTVPGVGLYQLDIETGEQNWFTKKIPVSTISPPTPLILNSVFYFNSSGRLRAVDTSTGKILWQVGGAGGLSSPVTDGQGIILANNARVTKFDPQSGEKIWVSEAFEAKRPDAERIRLFAHRVMASPAVSGGQVHVATTDGWIFSLDAQTGEQIASLYLARPFVAAPVISGNAMFLVSYDGTVFALTGLRHD